MAADDKPPRPPVVAPTPEQWKAGELDRLRKEAAELRAENKRLSESVVELEKRLNVREGRSPWYVGMGVDEAKQFDPTWKVDSDGPDGQILRFTEKRQATPNARVRTRFVLATVTAGKVSQIRFGGWEVERPAEPAPANDRPPGQLN